MEDALSPSEPAARAPRASGGGVVHVVGQITDAVFSFLGPATSALASAGRAQVLITHEDRDLAVWTARLDPAVRVIVVPASRGSVMRWVLLARQLEAVLASEAPLSLHLHGLMPGVIGALFARRLAREGTRVYVSPHSSRSLRSKNGLGRPFFWLMNALLGGHTQNAIANVKFDVSALGKNFGQSARLIESPVSDVFFTIDRATPATTAVVIGSGLAEGADSIPNFAQLAILMSHQHAGLSFKWIAPVGAHDFSPLEAAEVDVIDGADDRHRADGLAAASIYVTIGSSRGFPLPLAEAMASGVACVAFDAEPYRDFIRHGETGLLCEDVPAVMRAVAQLATSPELRLQLASAAREEALRRFSGAHFARLVQEAYQQGVSAPTAPFPKKTSTGLEATRGSV